MTMNANRLCLLVAMWLVLTAHHAFWSLLFRVNGAGPRALLFAAALLVALSGLNLLLLRLLSPGRSVRVMLTLLVLVASVSSWFMDAYGVSIDREMLRNVVQTDVAEASDFIGWSLLWRLLWQALPAWLLIWRVPLKPSGWLQSAGQYLRGMALGLLLLVGAALPMYASFASFFRNQNVAQHLLVPGNILVSAGKLVRDAMHARTPYVIVGADARRAVKVVGAAGKPMLTLLVVGETARAANFSLGGYARLTNPELAQRGVLYFSNVRSCGTATAMSVPCMFSDLPRTEFDVDMADRRDNVLDMLQRAGLAVSWLDNQSGCKRVCARVPTEEARRYHPSPCASECLDEALLYALDARLSGVTRDSVLVMHQMGSHGPSYHQRVPPDFVRFTPTCATERIENCSDAQIVNAYDNTIAYTDHVLAALIDRLQQRQQQFDSVLIYVSDHGESLGERGLYLHGQPYAIAPDLQKQVPMLMWFSSGAPERLHVDANCIRYELDRPYSHDNLSHTLLGLNDVLTSAYRPQLDMLRGCRRGPTPLLHVAISPHAFQS